MAVNRTGVVFGEFLPEPGIRSMTASVRGWLLVSLEKEEINSRVLGNRNLEMKNLRV